MSQVLKISTAAISTALIIALLESVITFFEPNAGNGIFVLVFVAAFTICFLHLVILGVPIFLFLKRKNWLNCFSIGIAGFLLGLLPLAIYSFPSQKKFEGYTSRGNWHGNFVSFYQDGVATIYGWLSYGSSLVMFGIFGVISSLIFWRLWVFLQSTKEMENT